MDELKNPIYSDFNIVKLSDMKDPKSNEIPNPMFGADVEKIAKIGPPRMPQLPADVSSDIAEKIAALSI